MRKILFAGSIILVSFIFLVSCTEEIDIDLNASDPQIVIEGDISTNGDPARISITKSVNFDESNTFPIVENATVEISDDLGNAEILDESSPGIYSSSEIIGMPGRTYTLQILAEDKTFSSVCLIPEQVTFDSLIVKETDGNTGGGPGSWGATTHYEIKVVYTDPAGQANYYRFVEIMNGEIEESYIFDDRLSDGLTHETDLIQFSRDLESGDTIQVIMQCIDKSVYEYFSNFVNLRGGPANSSTPANPITNIDGAVLGYFSAHTYEMKQVIIQ